MQEKSESSESSEQAKKINLKELRAQILSMSKQDAMDYILGNEWYGTPRPFQFAIQVRAGANLPGILEMYIRSSIANLGQIERAFNQSEKKIAELLGVKASAVHMAAHDLKEFGIVRKGKNGERVREWAIEEPKKEPEAENDSKPSNPVKELCVTQSKNCDLPSQNTVTDPVKELWPHNTRKDSKKKEKKKKEDKKERKPPSLLEDSIFFKKEDEDKAKAKALGYLNDFNLLTPLEFCKSYFGLLKMFKRGDLTEEEFDLVIASECLNLKGLQEFRRQAILAEWMIWYVLTPPRPDEHPYFTNFKKSWEDFSPIAIDLLETITAPERQQREAEAKASQEQQDKEDEEERILMEEQHRQRQEQAKADEEAKRQKAIEEEEARKKRAAEKLEAKRLQAEEFLNSLPTPEALRQAVNKVPLTPNWLDNQFGYMDFMNAMLGSVQFANLTAPIGSEYFNYTPLARDSFGGDNLAFERKSRDFAVAEVEIAIGELKAKGLSQFPKQTLDWKRFAQFFGIPEDARYERPKTMVAVGTSGEYESPFGKDEEDD